MKSKEEILKLLATPHLLPEARNLLEAQLAIIKDNEEKSKQIKNKKDEKKRFLISTAIGVFGVVIAIAALIVAIIK